MPLRYLEGHHSVGSSPTHPVRQFRAQNVELVMQLENYIIANME